MKICSKCKVEKSLGEYTKDSYKPDGLRTVCRDCTNDKQLKSYYKKKYCVPPIIPDGSKQCISCEQVKLLEFFDADNKHIDKKSTTCKECKKKYAQEWYKENKERHKEYGKQYSSRPESLARRRELGKTKYKASKAYHCAIRRASERNATPKWLTEEQKEQIKEFYRIAKHMTDFHEERYEVDHIAPLIGKTSCGLMVPWNLQVIHHIENRRKGNKLILDEKS